MLSVFDPNDILQIEAHGLTERQVTAQLENFRDGFGLLDIIRPATSGDGILTSDCESTQKFISVYEDRKDSLRIVKFVPASGAATRMFKELFEYEASGEKSSGVNKTLEQVEKFAFYDIIRENTGDDRETARAILDYGANLPKALIRFHNYPDGTRTAMEEHLAEGAEYASSNGEVNIHFTISPEHEDEFVARLEKVQPEFEKKYGVRYNVSFSCQQPCTDTIAATPENEPFRDVNGRLVFRPAGHGALIGNLNDLEADIIFIKNIDNVVPDRLRDDTTRSKKLLAGMLLCLQEKIFRLLQTLDEEADDSTLEEISGFISCQLGITLPTEYSQLSHTGKRDMLRSYLDRPLRICAMVRNEGEPGGGPFWVRNSDGSVSLQIAEPSQIRDDQKQMLKEGTHFNPVDIVCGTNNSKGEPFCLKNFVDADAGLITEKSLDGRSLKALELPGLWNGSMSKWNTVFVEVPVTTFTPVKELNDLLRPQHQ